MLGEVRTQILNQMHGRDATNKLEPYCIVDCALLHIREVSDILKSVPK